MTVPANLARVEGPSLVLRLIQPEDAAYVHGLRTDPAYNQHLSKVVGKVDDQRRWIIAYKAREAEGREYYYVIERKDGVRCGLVRLYNIELESFTWGSWILDAKKPRLGAVESAMLSFGVGFEILSISLARLDVRVGNAKALSFYRRLRMREVERSQQDIYLEYSKDKFVLDRAQLSELIKVGAAGVQ